MFEATNWVKLWFVVMQTVGNSLCHLRFSQTPIKVMKNSRILLNNSCETGIIAFHLTPKKICGIKNPDDLWNTSRAELSTLIQILVYYFLIESMLYLKIFLYLIVLYWIKDLLSVRGHRLFAVQGYSIVLVHLMRLSIWLPRDTVDFPLLEIFSLTSNRPLPEMNMISCLEARKSSKWNLEVPFSYRGVAVWNIFFFHYTGDRWFQRTPDWRSRIHTCHSC